MEDEAPSQYVGLIIGVLLTIITLLIAGTFFVILRIRRGKYTPTHSLVGARIHDRLASGIHFQVIYGSKTFHTNCIFRTWQLLTKPKCECMVKSQLWRMAATSMLIHSLSLLILPTSKATIQRYLTAQMIMQSLKTIGVRPKYHHHQHLIKSTLKLFHPKIDLNFHNTPQLLPFLLLSPPLSNSICITMSS